MGGDAKSTVHNPTRDRELTMKVQFKLGYYGYLVEQTDVPVLMEIFSRAVTSEGTFVNVSLEEAPDFARIKMKEELKKELGDEAARYSKYWMDERAKTEKLERELREFKDNA